MSKKWSEEEIKILRDNTELPLKEVIKLFPYRTKNSILGERKYLGIIKYNVKKWNDNEIELLANNKDKTLEELMNLLSDRSEQSIKQKARSLGVILKDLKGWDEEEIDFLLKNKEMYRSDIAKVLNKDPSVIRQKQKQLNIEPKLKQPQKFWTNEEMFFLKDNVNLPLKELAKILKRPIGSVGSKRLELGIRYDSNKWTDNEIKILIDNKDNLLNINSLLPNRTSAAAQSKLISIKFQDRSNFFCLIENQTKEKENFINNDSSLIKRKHKKHKLDQTFTIDDLDNSTFQVLFGSMLGDGGITNQNRNQSYIYKETHGIEQIEYMEWKRKMLSIFCPNKITCKETKPVFSTPTHPIFNLLRKEMYSVGFSKKSYIPLKYAERLDELGLLIWYLDDGTFNDGNPEIYNSMFSKENLEQTISVVNKKFNLTLEVANKGIICGKMAKRIKFRAVNRNKIIPIFEHLFDEYNVPQLMRYKIERVGLIKPTLS